MSVPPPQGKDGDLLYRHALQFAGSVLLVTTRDRADRMTAEALLDHFAILEGVYDRRRARRARRPPSSAASTSTRSASRTSAPTPAACIVDEPTAGLGPGQRVRFHNLLAEIGDT